MQCTLILCITPSLAGGILLITDYCRGDQDPTKQFKEYVKQRGYNLLTVKVSQPYFCPALFCYLYFMGLQGDSRLVTIVLPPLS